MRIKILILFIFLFTAPPSLYGWSSHNVMTKQIFKDVSWLKHFQDIEVTTFKSFLRKAYPNKMTQKGFLKEYVLNESTTILFKNKKPADQTSALEILISYVDEPDWGMDKNLDVSPDQPWMGGTKGPTSQAFRHLYWKKWSAKAPWRTFHIPPREMGEALGRAQLYFDLSEKAFRVGETYWAFRFLAWSLHYVQDLGQPFHSTQLLTPKFLAWNLIFNFKKLVQRCTRIISNFHFLYEYYVIYKIQAELKQKKGAVLLPALSGQDHMQSSSAYLIARHASNASSHMAYKIGEASYTFFGKESLNPNVDVPNSPPSQFPMKKFDLSKRISKRKKRDFLKTTAKCLRKTAFYSRSLLELAKQEFLKGN